MPRLSQSATCRSRSSTCPARCACSALIDYSPSLLTRAFRDSIDAILYSPVLRVHDHLRLAATCRSLRSAYYTAPRGNGFTSFSSPVWKALRNERDFQSLGKNRYYYGNAYSAYGGQSKEESERILRHLWSREDRVDPEKMLVVAQKTVAGRKGRGGVVTPATVVTQVVRSVEWDDVIETLSKQVLSFPIAICESCRSLACPARSA